MTIKELSANKVFDGSHKQYGHYSKVLNCDMTFAIYLPPVVTKGVSVPVLYWLSGLTCNEQNFMQKAGAQRVASELGLAIVVPDTSPRGGQVKDDESYDLGQGAGFYLNATQTPWSKNYRMYDYIVEELPNIIRSNFLVTSKQAIAGHSMGGHGALTIGLKNPGQYTSISAFSPISNPSRCPWGIKAFKNYLGDDENEWLIHDASELMKKATQFVPTLVDQGSADEFLTEQLMPESLVQAAKKNNFPLKLNTRDGYDHSYYFISSFIEQHLKFHQQYLIE
jgi:S-formylglutathione hydrolase